MFRSERLTNASFSFGPTNLDLIQSPQIAAIATATVPIAVKTEASCSIAEVSIRAAFYSPPKLQQVLHLLAYQYFADTAKIRRKLCHLKPLFSTSIKMRIITFV